MMQGHKKRPLHAGVFYAMRASPGAGAALAGRAAP